MLEPALDEYSVRTGFVQPFIESSFFSAWPANTLNKIGAEVISK